MKRSLFGSTSKARILLDAAWIVSFAVVLVLLYGGGEGKAAFDGSVKLELAEGKQVRGIYLRKKRVGRIEHQIERVGAGWRVTQRFFAELAGQRVDVGWSRLTLREDLSLDKIAVSVDPEKLGQIMGVGRLAGMLSVGKVKLHGACWIKSGRCSMEGRIGDRRVDRSVMAGRGPVVPSALFPLLVRGVLGSRAELVVFDPMSMTRKVVTYQTRGYEQIEVGGRRFRALRVDQDVEGMPMALWLDERGRILKEQLPMGLWVEHEAFQ